MRPVSRVTVLLPNLNCLITGFTVSSLSVYLLYLPFGKLWAQPGFGPGHVQTGLVLATQTQAADQAAVTAQILAFQVVQQLATLVSHADQTATGVVILLVVLEVPLQLVDVCSQQSYLDFRRTGVAFSTRILGNDCSFFFNAQCHDSFPLR